MSRRGYVLVELAAVIAVGSVLLGIASGLLVLLMGVEQSSRESLRQQVALANLARQFRSDAGGCIRILGRVGQARQASAGPPSGTHGGPSLAPGELVPPYSAGWQFEEPEGTIVRYRVQGNSLIRVLVDRGVVREQEAYQLPEECASLAGAVRRPRASHRQPVDHDAPGQACPKRARAVEIDAALGADRTLLAPGGHAGLDHGEVSP